MKSIPLSQGQAAIVDDVDYERLSQFKWTAMKRRNGLFYAVRSERIGVNRRRLKQMHAEIMGRRLGYEVDHANRDSLDNRRGNLRWATHSQNSYNSSRAPGQTGAIGIDRHGNKYVARLHSRRKTVYRESFDTLADAASAYNAAARLLCGQFGRQNAI